MLKKPMTTKELSEKDKMPDIPDYGPGAYRPVQVETYESDLKSSPVYGGSEGAHNVRGWLCADRGGDLSESVDVYLPDESGNRLKWRCVCSSMEAALKRKDELIEKRPQVNLSIDKFWLLSINMKIHSRINRRYNKTAPAKTLWPGLCICVKNICSIQFPIMAEQTDVSVNVFEKIFVEGWRPVRASAIGPAGRLYIQTLKTCGSRRCRNP